MKRPRYAIGMRFRIAVSAVMYVSSVFAGVPHKATSSVNLDGCSATIIVRGKSVAYGLSCSHCAKVGKRFSFVCVDGTTGGKGKWIVEDESEDLALFECRTVDTLGSSPVWRRLPAGRPVAVGFPGGRGPAIKTLRPIENTAITNLEGRRYRFDIDSGHFAGGDSGGGVFIAGGLVSVMSHGTDDVEMYGATHTAIVDFLDSAAKKTVEPLVKSGDPPQDGDRVDQSRMWGDKDRTGQILQLWQALKGIEKVPGPKGPKGDPGTPGTTDDVAELRRVVMAQQKQINKLLSTPIVVQVLDPTTGQVVAEKSYPFGTPVRLVLPKKQPTRGD